MYLPSEILQEVGRYLNLSDKSACLRVCYSWYEPFLSLLYTKVHLTSRYQFRLFYNAIKQSAKINNPLGYIVQEIHFDHGLTCKEFESLPDYFENLEILNFDQKLWRFMRYSKKITQMKKIRRLPTMNRTAIFQPLLEDTAILSQLTYLSLSGEATQYLLNNNLTTSIWTRMSKLESLLIKGTQYTELNVKMMMAIGAQLPFLKYLTLSCVSLPLSESDMNSTTTFPLFTSAVSLRLDDVYIRHWRMITFLSLAFYHTQVLDLDITLDWLYDEHVTIDVYEQSMDAFMGFAQLCIFLKKVVFRKIKTSVFPFPYDAFFLEVADIHEHVSIEMGECAWWSTIDPAPSFKAVTSQTGFLTKAELKWSWTGKKTEKALFKCLRCCHHLTDLELDCDVFLKNGLKLDVMLNHCRSLKSVKLSSTLITAVNSADKTKYGLKSLKLKHVTIGDGLMDFVSQNCLELDELWMEDCVQEKPRRSGFVVIRMPEHQFKSIKVNGIHLNHGSKCEVNMTILSIYESKRYMYQTERRKSKDQTTKTPEMWRFYHVHQQGTRSQLRRLSTEEAALVANFEMTEKRWKLVTKSTKRKSYVNKELWKKDIQFGAILVLCKSVEELEFNELKV